VITGGTVIDPGNRICHQGDIGVKDGVISELGQDLTGRESSRYADATGFLVTPGLVDIHTHLYSGVSHYGVDPDLTCLVRGVTRRSTQGRLERRPSQDSVGT